MKNKPLALVLGAITLLAAVLRLWGIGSQPLTLDEIMTPATAVSYVHLGVPGPTMPFHPNLRNILIDFSLHLFGPSAAGIKGWSLLFGTLCVPLVGLLVWRVSRSIAASGAVALLIATDPLMLDFSRQAIQEIWTTFFCLLALWLVSFLLDTDDRWAWIGLPIAAGVAFGCGVASKFYVVPLEAAAMLYLGWIALRRRGWADAVWVSGSILGVSFLTFVLTYAPWFGNGHSAVEWFAYQRALVETISTHSFQLGLNRFIQPVLWFNKPFVGWMDMQYARPLPAVAVAAGNPFTWLMVFPAAIYLLVRRRNWYANRVMQGLFWVSYLPLAFAGRFIYVFSAVIVLPFAFALLALALVDLAKRYGTWLFYGYLVIAVLSALLLDPAAVGGTLRFNYLKPLVHYESSGPLIPPIEQQLK